MNSKFSYIQTRKPILFPILHPFIPHKIAYLNSLGFSTQVISIPKRPSPSIFNTMSLDYDDPASVASEPPQSSKTNTNSKAELAIESLSQILSPLPPSVTNTDNPGASLLLHDPDLSNKISCHLRQPNSGSGDNNLCRWLYDTFQSSDPNLQLVVLRFLPTIAGIYLSRAILRKPQAGFEAILLALYAHETINRCGQPITANIPDLGHPSIYHETKVTSKNNATELNLAILSPSLEPHGTVRSTERARIVGVTLELYYSKISQMSEHSKRDFCKFCVVWAGQGGDMFKDEQDYENAVASSSKSHENKSEINIENAPIANGDTEEGKISVSMNKDGKKSVSASYPITMDAYEEGKRNVSTDDSNANDAIKDGKTSVSSNKEVSREEKEGRIPLPWELLQPTLRILSHCLMAPNTSKELKQAALAASRSLYARALHDVNSQAILASGSLLRVGKLAMTPCEEPDPTEIRDFGSNVIII